MASVRDFGNSYSAHPQSIYLASCHELNTRRPTFGLDASASIYPSIHQSIHPPIYLYIYLYSNSFDSGLLDESNGIRPLNGPPKTTLTRQSIGLSHAWHSLGARSKSEPQGIGTGTCLITVLSLLPQSICYQFSSALEAAISAQSLASVH